LIDDSLKKDCAVFFYMSVPDSKGDCKFQLVIGDPRKEVTEVRGWMLEAVERAIGKFKQVRKRLKKNVVLDFMRTERALRHRMEEAQRAAESMQGALQDHDDDSDEPDGGKTPPEPPPTLH